MKTNGKTTRDHVGDPASHQYRLIRSKLGPLPGAALQAMADYGLNDNEIGQYFGVSGASIHRLRKQFDTAQRVDEPA